MVIKTDECFFSKKKIFPGRGIRYVTKNGKLMTFIGAKDFRLFKQNKKPAKIKWTVDWRRQAKKTAILSNTRRVKKKKTTVNRAIEGMALTTILQKKQESEASRKAEREKRLKNLKDQRAKQKKEREKKRGKTTTKPGITKGGPTPGGPKTNKGKGKERKTKGGKVKAMGGAGARR